MTSANALPTARLYAYGVLAIPLAMLMLPVYVHVPKFYADQFGLALGTQGLLLVAARGFDALQDPWLGHLSDRARGIDRRAWILGGAPLLACASYGLFAPPAWAHAHIAWWFVCMLVLVYTALALVQNSRTPRMSAPASPPSARASACSAYWPACCCRPGVCLRTGRRRAMAFMQ